MGHYRPCFCPLDIHIRKSGWGEKLVCETLKVGVHLRLRSRSNWLVLWALWGLQVRSRRIPVDNPFFLFCILMCTGRWRCRPWHGTVFRTFLFGSKHLPQSTKKRKHHTFFYVLPLGRNQRACVFDNPRRCFFWRSALRRLAEALPNLSVLQDLGALGINRTELNNQAKVLQDKPVTAWCKNGQERVSHPIRPYSTYVRAGCAPDWTDCMGSYLTHRMWILRPCLSRNDQHSTKLIQWQQLYLCRTIIVTADVEYRDSSLTYPFLVWKIEIRYPKAAFRVVRTTTDS